MHERELAKAIRELTAILREWRSEFDATLLEAEIVRHARFTRRLERIATALARLDAATPRK